jgi:hypothetical protein
MARQEAEMAILDWLLKYVRFFNCWKWDCNSHILRLVSRRATKHTVALMLPADGMRTCLSIRTSSSTIAQTPFDKS